MTQSTRRTAKITTLATQPQVTATTKPAAARRPYIAIWLSGFDARQAGTITAKTTLSFTGVGGATLIIEAGQQFRLAAAESLGAGYFYIVLLDVYGVKKCSCPASKPCKHEIAMAAKVADRQAKPATQPASDAAAVKPALRLVSSVERDAAARGTLNGASQGFCLLRR